MANFDFLSSEVEVDEDDDMGDDGSDDGYNPEIKLKGASDVLDQVDKDTEEVLDFNFVPGSESGQDSNVDSVDGVKGDFDDNDFDADNATNHQERSGDWGLGSSGGVVHFAPGGKNQQQQQQPQQPRPPSAGSNSSGSEKDLTGNLELGELGQLTITNDNESSYDQISTPK